MKAKLINGNIVITAKVNHCADNGATAELNYEYVLTRKEATRLVQQLEDSIFEWREAHK